jgi:hypothetical protein
MPLTLEANNTQVIKSHTGGAMSMGKGIIYGTSTRQKLNTKSSTEGELVGVNDVMPQVLWTRYFLEAQGYDVQESIIYQDSQSTMLLAMNGTASSSRRTRHINIRYFFVADRVASGEVKIEYCPTAQMLADYFTKPLQGNLFRTMRNMIMNVNPTSDHTYAMQDYRSVLNMCNGHVGNGYTNYTDIDNDRTNHASVQTNEQEWITAEPRNIRIRDSVSGTSETGSL